VRQKSETLHFAHLFCGPADKRPFEEMANLQVSLGGVSILIRFVFPPHEVKLISIQKFEMHEKPTYKMFEKEVTLTLSIQL
tara:strand:+ start:69 stop:311 length:243 start_codon:yes stop_codon:yes gene_type:complete